MQVAPHDLKFIYVFVLSPLLFLFKYKKHKPVITLRGVYSGEVTIIFFLNKRLEHNNVRRISEIFKDFVGLPFSLTAIAVASSALF